MSEMYGQTEKALSKGADFVDQARGDVKNKCGVLSGNIQTMMGGWGGQGATAFNNLVGLRPTQGLVSRSGIVPLSHTQDIGGPLARTATDLAIALDVTVGYDAADSAGDQNDHPADVDCGRRDVHHEQRPQDP